MAGIGRGRVRARRSFLSAESHPGTLGHNLQQLTESTPSTSTQSTSQGRGIEMQLQLQADLADPDLRNEGNEGQHLSHQSEGRGSGPAVTPKMESESSPDLQAKVSTEDEDRKKKSAKLKLNTLYNEVVMENIAKRLPVRSLLDLRRTCPSWNSAFIPEVRKKHEPIVLRSGDVEGKTRNTDDFMETLRSSQNFPFSRYYFGGPNQQSPPLRTYDCRNYQQLVKNFGSTITSFTGSWQNWQWPESGDAWQSNYEVRVVKRLRSDLLFGLKLMPTLTELTLEPGLVNLHWRDQEISQDTLRVVDSLPKLKRFSVITEAFNENTIMDIVPEFCQLVSDITQSATGLEFLKISDGTRDNKILQSSLAGLFLNPKQQLKILDVSSLSAENVKSLLELSNRKKNPLQLNSFIVQVQRKAGQDDYRLELEVTRFLHDFLVSQVHSLENLTLNSESNEHWVHYSALVRIPRMERVKNFTLNRDNSYPFVEYAGLPQHGLKAIMIAFPAMRQFSSAYCHDLSRSLEAEIGAVHYGVKELVMTAFPDQFMRFTRLRLFFPSLTRLEINFLDLMHEFHREDLCEFCDETDKMSEYRQIWRSWPNLTVVKITGEFNGPSLDTFLTGLPAHNMRIAEEKLRSLESFNLPSLRRILTKYNTMPAISDLKQLQELTIDVHSLRKAEDDKSRQDHELRLTNIGAYFGIALASRHLQRVSIKGDTENDVSEVCQQFLRTTFGPYSEINL